MIFILGANGWLGLNLIDSIVSGRTDKWGLKNSKIHAFILKGTSKKKLMELSPKIKIYEGDILSKTDLENFFTVSRNSIVFHLAGVIHPKNISEFYRVNVQGTRNILEVGSKQSIDRMIIMSSNSPLGCNENNKSLFDENSPYNPYMNYGKSKMLMEEVSNKFYERGLMDLTIIRSPWFYGPYQPPRQKIFFELIRSGKVPIIGEGENVRSMGYTENLIQGMVLASVSKIASGNTYWIADKKPYSMNEIINTIENILSNDLKIKCNHGRIYLPGLVSALSEGIDNLIQSFGLYNQKIHVLSEMGKNIACNIDLAEKELSYEPEFDLKKGMLNCLRDAYE